ncbi:hypothetical protein KS4_32270 [Poriferisphaera corsica]|uniref:Uncharacterized protein n=2 Tax=Poriferisphaera corsica TaxID=2528020 RepID=A0A517YY67_9BACT|nr:hypothetical protein KS4_32270 [Poriferisphaera corsica]
MLAGFGGWDKRVLADCPRLGDSVGAIMQDCEILEVLQWEKGGQNAGDWAATREGGVCGVRWGGGG